MITASGIADYWLKSQFAHGCVMKTLKADIIFWTTLPNC
jgi:hypothetical protein